MKRLISLLLVAIFSITMFAGCKGETSEEFNLETAKIGVLTGSMGERYVDSNLPNAKKFSYASIMDSYTALQTGKIDAVIMDQPNIINVTNKNKDLIMQSEQCLTSEPTSIGIKKGNDELLASINDILTTLKNDGNFDDMKKRWIKLDGSLVEPVDIPKADGEPLKIGVAPTLEPFCYVSNNIVTGLDIELINRIALSLNRKVELVQMDFGALISSLQSGKVDVIISLITASEERKKSINFTQTYYESGQAVLIKKPLQK